jgi:ADP-heptose:LPS heptosyltransferase
MFAGIVRRASAVIANNSLAMHLADAFRVPSVVLYAGTDLEAHWRPRSTAARLLRRPVAYSPCHAIDCPRALECLDVPPSEVVEALLEVVALASMEAVPA